MIQELSEKIWSNPDLHKAAALIETAWLHRELKLPSEAGADEKTAIKAVNAATILACSTKDEQRAMAYKIATCVYDLFGKSNFPFDTALRVVLARLENFPAIRTKANVREAIKTLPWSLASEEIQLADKRTVEINSTPIALTAFQHALWTDLFNHSSIAFSAPTSAGKSFVLEHYLASIAAENKTSVVYIVPTRALISQVAGDLDEAMKRFLDVAPSIVTVPPDKDKPLPNPALYVMTQERVQITLFSHPTFSPAVIVVDEAQSIADGSRGMLLQTAIEELIERNPGAQILFASPTIRNLGVFRKLFELKNVEERFSREPTVAQNFLIVEVSSASKGRIKISTAAMETRASVEIAEIVIGETLASRVDRLVHIPAYLGVGQANLIYTNTADEAEKVAMQLADKCFDRVTTEAQEQLATLAEDAVHRDYVLGLCVRKGIGFHYGNIPTILRQAIEDAFKNGDLDFLVCTSTLLQGVNLPAKNIFMYAPKKGIKVRMEAPDFWNLAGRAGRLLKEFQGNIFLIDYDDWEVKLLGGARDTMIVPAMRTTITEDTPALMDFILDAPNTTKSLKNDSEAESAFVRLLSDLKRGTLPSTFSRLSLDDSPTVTQQLTQALTTASANVSLPPAVLRQSPNVSAHKQEKLFAYLSTQVGLASFDPKNLLPAHPRDAQAYNSYERILELCHSFILGLDTKKGLHKFHAVMATKWMEGTPLPMIVGEQIARNPDKNKRAVIRNTLQIIESEIRFQVLRLFTCYTSLLTFALSQANRGDVIEGMPAIQIFLEVGASDRTMISFMELGLSRIVAAKLNEISSNKNLDIEGARQWILSRPIQNLGLSRLLQNEVEKLVTQVKK